MDDIAQKNKNLACHICDKIPEIEAIEIYEIEMELKDKSEVSVEISICESCQKEYANESEAEPCDQCGNLTTDPQEVCTDKGRLYGHPDDQYPPEYDYYCTDCYKED